MATKQHNSHARFYGLLKELPGAEKEALIWEYSNMLTTSLVEFYQRRPEQYRRMIADMERTVLQNKRDDATKTALIIERELKNRRSSILKRLQKLGVDTTSWPAVNKFMRNPRIAGKTLGEMDTEEMDALIPKLEAILRKDKAKDKMKLMQTCFSKN